MYRSQHMINSRSFQYGYRYIHTYIHMYIDTVTTTLPPETALHGLLLDECASLQETPPIGTRNNANGPISIRDFDYRHNTGFFCYRVWPSALRRGESKEYEVVKYVKRTLLADFVSAVSEPNFPSWNENLLPCMHSFWKFPRTANNDCAHLLGIYRNSIGSWKVTGVLRIITYNARHRLNLLHHRWSVDAYFLYFVIVFHTCARVNGLIYYKILSFSEVELHRDSFIEFHTDKY